jgi:hypothetical protein
MKELNLNISYELLKGTPFGYFYYNILDKNIGNFIDGEPEKSYLISSIKSVIEFIEKANRTSFLKENIEELFEIACKQYIGETPVNEYYINLQYNLSIIPQTDIFDGFRGGIFCLQNEFRLYCTFMNTYYISDVIDLKTFEYKFNKIITKMKTEGVYF